MAAEEDWEIEHVDIKTAFLHGIIDHEIYIRLPDGSIRLLNKGIYGLKQASRLWTGRFHKTLTNLGFTRCENDPCCYTINDSPTPLIIIIHVDDSVIFGKDLNQIAKFKRDLATEYPISDLGPIKHALGWEIKRNRRKRTLTINQQQYTFDILKKFDMDHCHTKSTPAEPNVIFSKEQSPITPLEKEHMEKFPYLELLGCLIYLATCTRPDISCAVSELASFASNPGVEHWDGLRHILQYLAGTAGYGISYGHSHSNRELKGFVDASYSRCVDTRCSRYGGVYLMNNGPIEWKSKLQTIVALSSMEAEYIGACEFTRIGVWLRRCLSEIAFPPKQATLLGCDNKSAITFAEEFMIQNRSKHIDTKYHYIREKIKEKSISLFYVPTKEMPADILTKPLALAPFRKCRRSMGILRVAHDRD